MRKCDPVRELYIPQPETDYKRWRQILPKGRNREIDFDCACVCVACVLARDDSSVAIQGRAEKFVGIRPPLRHAVWALVPNKSSSFMNVDL